MKAGSNNWMSVLGADVLINIHKPATFGGHKSQSSIAVILQAAYGCKPMYAWRQWRNTGSCHLQT